MGTLRSSQIRAALVRAWPFLTLAVLLILIGALSSRASAETQGVVIVMLIEVVMVVGLYIFVGNSGVLSFGHMSFAAIGGYTASLLTIPLTMRQVILPTFPGLISHAELSTLPALLVGGLLAAAIATVVGVPLMRLRGIAASIGTLAFLIITHTVISNWDDVTHGTSTLLGMPLDTTMTETLVWALIAMAVAYVYQESGFGLRLRASREDEVASKAVGVSVSRERLIAFALSAFFVGIGGGLYAHFLGSITPDAYYLDITFLTIAMLVIGGIDSLAGAVIGTIVVSTVAEGFRRVEEGFSLGSLHVGSAIGLREVALALFMLLILLFRPSGITGGYEIYWPWKGRLILHPSGEHVVERETTPAAVEERDLPPVRS